MRRPLPGLLTFSAGSLSVVLSLLVVLALAAFLRFHDLGRTPAGLYVDEAGDTWNAWCLAKTGRDFAGERWPVFYTRCFGDYRSAAISYAILPFVALWGLSTPSARLAGAVAGELAVFCMFVVGRRLFDGATGLFAALFLAISTWHVQQSRWVHDATLGPFLAILPIALLVSSRLVRSGTERKEVSAGGETTTWASSSQKIGTRPILSLLAGLVAGTCCYGYPAVRVFLPVFLLGIFASGAVDTRRLLRDRAGKRALLLFLLGGFLTFGPLVFSHLTDPVIGKRGTTTWVWEDGDGFGTKAAKVLARYPGHFDPGFLFGHGGPELYPLAPPPGYGLMFRWMLPLVLLGLATALAHVKESPSARLLVAWFALYPAADLLNRHEGMSIPRSAPGLPVFALLAAVGGVAAFRWIAERSRNVARTAAVALLLLLGFSVVRFFLDYFGTHDRLWDRYRYFVFQNDLLAAGEWLRPRFEAADAVVVTTLGMTHPYVYTLLSLGYDPARWLADEKTIVSGPLQDGSYDHEDVVARYGKVWFLYVGLPMPAPLTGEAPPGRRIIFIVRPGQLGLEKSRPPDFEVRTPWGKPILWCFDVQR